MELLSLFGIVVLVIIVWRLRDRVIRIEEQLQSPPYKPTTLPQPSGVPAPTAPAVSAVPARRSVTVPIPALPAAPTVPPLADRFIRWAKEDWLLKLGALLIIIAFGWFARYAFLRGWVGAQGRIAIGLIVGALILILGWWRMRKFVHQGAVFLVLGSTVILLTTFAARELYGFFTPLSALIIMFLSSAFVAAGAITYKSEGVALASLILANVAPFLTNSPSPNYVSLFAYLLVVTVGTLWIVAFRQWRSLAFASLLAVALYSLPHLTWDSHKLVTATLLLFAYAFAALFFLTNTLGLLRLRGKDSQADLITAGGNGLFLLAWIMIVAPKEWQSLIIVAWMLVFTAGAFALFKLTSQRYPFYVYAGVGVAMLAAATAVELDGAALTLAYTIESGLIPFIVYFTFRDTQLAERSSLLLLGPVVLSFNSITSSAWAGLPAPTRYGPILPLQLLPWYERVFHKDFFVLLVLALTLAAVGGFIWWQRRRQKQPTTPVIYGLVVAGTIYIYELWWLTWHAALTDDDQAIFLSLLLYTLVGLITYIYGRLRELKLLRLYGSALLLFVVGRLLVIDVWKLALVGRIVTFFAIGVLLASTAFLGRHRASEKP